MSSFLWACAFIFFIWTVAGVVRGHLRSKYEVTVRTQINEQRLQSLRDAAGIGESGTFTDREYQEMLALMLAVGEVKKQADK